MKHYQKQIKLQQKRTMALKYKASEQLKDQLYNANDVSLL